MKNLFFQNGEIGLLNYFKRCIEQSERYLFEKLVYENPDFEIYSTLHIKIEFRKMFITQRINLFYTTLKAFMASCRIDIDNI